MALLTSCGALVGGRGSLAVHSCECGQVDFSSHFRGVCLTLGAHLGLSQRSALGLWADELQ